MDACAGYELNCRKAHISKVNCLRMQGGIVSPGSTGIGASPASKPSPMRAGALGVAPASPAAPAPVDDPFSAFNPFKH